MPREFPQAPIVGVGGVVIQGDEVLLIKRKYEPLKGEWSLPGGGLELGETLQDGVAREVLEETGLVVRPTVIVEVIDRIHHEVERVKYHYVLIDFLCEFVSGDVRAASDAQEARWVRLEEIGSHGEYKLAAATVAVIDKAFRLAQAARIP